MGPAADAAASRAKNARLSREPNMNTRGGLDRKPYVALIGGGVHGVVLVDCIHAAGNARVVGYSDTAEHDALHMRRMAIPLLGDDEALLERIDAGLIDATI